MRLWWFQIRRTAEEFGRRHPAASMACLIWGLILVISVAVAAPWILQDLLAGEASSGGFLLSTALFAFLMTAYVTLYYAFQSGVTVATAKAFGAIGKLFAPTMRWIVSNLVLPKGRS